LGGLTRYTSPFGTQPKNKIMARVKKPICTGNALAEWVMVLIFFLPNTG
jgi:hypothetical protein